MDSNMEATPTTITWPNESSAWPNESSAWSNESSTLNVSAIKKTYPNLFVLHPELTYSLFIALCFLTVFGTIGNTLVILSVIMNKQLRITANIFVVNLALADLGISAFVNPFAIAGLIDGHRLFEELYPKLCAMVASICFASCVTSLLNIMAISINRYIAVCRHQYYARIFTHKNTILMAIGLWMLAWAVELPNHFGWGGNWFDPKGMACLYNRTKHFSFTFFLAVPFIILPCIIIGICYLKIYTTIREAKKNLMKNDSGKSSVTRQDKQLAKTLFVIFIVFIIFWMPYAFLILIDFDDNASKEVHSIILNAAHSNSGGLNALVYAATNTRFRESFKTILCCRWRQLMAGQLGSTTATVRPAGTASSFQQKSLQAATVSVQMQDSV